MQLKINLLNLDRSPERLSNFMANNAHLSDVLRVAAVDGLTLSPECLVEQGVLDHVLPEYTPGALGCALSHIRQWREVAQEASHLTIAEDDAIFHLDFERLASGVLDALPPDWDIIQWGWNFDSVLVFDLPAGISSCGAIFDQERLCDHLQAFQTSRISPNPYRLMRSFGTVAQTISPRGARELLDFCLPIRSLTTFYPVLNRVMPNLGIDSMMNNLYPKINAYVCIPPLVVTKNDRADSTVQSSNFTC